MNKPLPSRRSIERLVRLLIENPRACLRKKENGDFALGEANTKSSRNIASSVVATMLADGLLRADRSNGYRASAAAKSWLVREKTREMAYKAQHGEFEYAIPPGATGNKTVLVNRCESPIARLARRRDRSGNALLQPFQVAAAERLRSDFERGQLQPRITANWQAAVSSRRRSDGAAVENLTETALAARQRFDQAIAGVGPEFAGVLIDACCLLKGLKTIECERLWPARSAKLVLQLALAALARHYGFVETARGPQRAKSIRSWRALDSRPEIC